jgi:hypothetical protein
MPQFNEIMGHKCKGTKYWNTTEGMYATGNIIQLWNTNIRAQGHLTFWRLNVF